jgi:Effector-associated domain 11
LKTLLAKEKTDDVLERLLDITEANDKDAHNTVLLLSARLNRINSQEHKGVISNGEAGIERNKINAALTSLIDELA